MSAVRRKFKSLPLYIYYRCGKCQEAFSVTKLPKDCPLCGASLEEVGYSCLRDEIIRK